MVEVPADTQPDEDPVLDRAVAELRSSEDAGATMEPSGRRHAPLPLVLHSTPTSYDHRGLTFAAG